MALSLVTAPTIEPLSYDEAKAHCRVDTDEESGLLNALIQTAREYAERYTSRALLPQTWDWKLDAFPCGEFVLPLPPVTSITSISYVDTDGDSQTWSSALYRTDLPSGPTAARARIEPVYGEVYPQTRALSNAVTVRFVCGYANEAAVPSSIKAAMLLLIGHWYGNREPVVVGAITTSVPLAVDALLWPYKVF